MYSHILCEKQAVFLFFHRPLAKNSNPTPLEVVPLVFFGLPHRFSGRLIICQSPSHKKTQLGILMVYAPILANQGLFPHGFYQGIEIGMYYFVYCAKTLICLPWFNLVTVHYEEQVFNLINLFYSLRCIVQHRVRSTKKKIAL